MPVLRTDQFRGMAPRIDAHNLPPGFAQKAVNCKLFSGILEPWKAPLAVLTTASGLGTLRKYGAKWLCWTPRVSVVNDPVADAAEQRILWSGDGIPKQSNAALLAIGAATHAIDTPNWYPLRIPAPAQAPAVTVGGDGPAATDVRTYVYAWTHGSVIGAKSATMNVAVGRHQNAQLEGLDTTPPATWRGKAARETAFRKAVFLVDAEANQYILVKRLNFGDDTYVDDGKQRGKRYGPKAFKGTLIPAPTSPVNVLTDDGSGLTGWTLGVGWTHGASEFSHTAGAAGDLTRAVTGLTIGNTYVIYGTTANVTAGTVDIQLDAAVLAANVGESGLQVARFTATATSHNVVFAASSAFAGSIADIRVDDAATMGVTAISSVDSADPKARSYVYCWIYQLGGVTYRTDASFAGSISGVVDGEPVIVSGMAANPASAFPSGAKAIRKVLFRSDNKNPPVYRAVKTLRRRQTQYTDSTKTRKLKWKITRFSVGLSGSPTAPVATVKPADDSGDALDQESRAYVTTFVSAWGQESAPSPVSDPVSVYPWEAVTVAGDVAVPAGNPHITGWRVYRTDSTGVFRLVSADALPIATASMDDAVETVDLGTELASADWDVPPDDLAGIVTLPNGGVLGFSGKTLCPSEIDVPYAFPVKYRKTTESAIVALGVTAYGTVVATETVPYLLHGTDPAAMSLERLDNYQACMSAASMVDLGEVVAYASPDGIVGVAAGEVKLLTAEVLTRDQWQAYAPASMHAYRYEGRYLAFYNTGLVSGALLFDPAAGDLVEITVSASAGYNDPLTDTLFLQVGAALSQWDAGAALTMEWIGGRVLFDTALCPAAGRLDADGYPMTVELYAGGDLKHSAAVQSVRGFRWPAGYRSFDFHYRVTGAHTVRRVTLATSMQELGA